MFIKEHNKIQEGDNIQVVSSKLKEIESELVNIPIDEYAKIINELKDDIAKVELQLMQYIMDENNNVIGTSLVEVMDQGIFVIKKAQLAYRKKGEKPELVRHK